MSGMIKPCVRSKECETSGCYSCSRCQKAHCMSCDGWVDTKEYKTAVRYCQYWRCQREMKLEQGQLIAVDPQVYR